MNDLFLWIAHLLPIKTYSAVVEPGILIRGSKQEDDELEALIAKYQLRSIVSFNQEDERGDFDVQARLGLYERGIRCEWFPTRDGDALSLQDAQRFVAWMNDPKNQPGFAHCRQGRGRTGDAVGCWRVFRGWTAERAIEEAVVYGMPSDGAQAEAIRDYAASLEPRPVYFGG